MGGVIFFIVLVIYFSHRGNGKGVTGDVYSDSWLTCVMVWIGLAIGWVYVNDHARDYLLPYLISASVLFLPSLWSLLTVRFGWVKLSYYLGRISFVVFRRSQKAGAMWKGLQAAYYLKSDERKREALQWLKTKFLNKKGVVFSGEMVMYVIIDAFLQKPRDPDFMAQQLEMLRGIGTASIPRPVANLALKLALAPALARRDYEEIQSIVAQWDTDTTVPIQRFLREFFAYYVKLSRYASRPRIFFWKLFIFKFKNLRHFPKQYLQDVEIQQQKSENIKNHDLNLIELFHLRSITPEASANLKDKLTNSEQKQKWINRANELGVWNTEEAWTGIEQSVNRLIQVKSDKTDGEYDPEIERHFVNMRYVCDSIARRLTSKKYGHGVQNFLDWLKIRELMREMAKDEHVLNAAFSSNHHIIWNWVADLWNKKKHRCLAHYIASVCAPIASYNGHKEMSNILNGIVCQQFK